MKRLERAAIIAIANAIYYYRDFMIRAKNEPKESWQALVFVLIGIGLFGLYVVARSHV